MRLEVEFGEWGKQLGSTIVTVQEECSRNQNQGEGGEHEEKT